MGKEFGRQSVFRVSAGGRDEHRRSTPAQLQHLSVSMSCDESLRAPEVVAACDVISDLITFRHFRAIFSARTHWKSHSPSSNDYICLTSKIHLNAFDTGDPIIIGFFLLASVLVTNSVIIYSGECRYTVNTNLVFCPLNLELITP